MFVNRVSELALLEKHYRSDRAEFFILYGRRKVGKTELLAHFCEGKPHVFFVADQISEQILRTNLSMAINDAIFGVGQVSAVYNTWDDLFNTRARQAQSKRLVVVIDEFPYLMAAYPPLASILQHLWDQTLKNSQIMLILNGSYIRMMEETVLGYQAPLYGRRTAQYLLEPLDFLDAQYFFQAYTPEDRLRAYAVYGGTPAYLQTIRPENTLETNIIETVLERDSLLMTRLVLSCNKNSASRATIFLSYRRSHPGIPAKMRSNRPPSWKASRLTWTLCNNYISW